MDDSYVNGFSKFGDNNENDKIRSPKLQKPKKVVMKHFMEPTISAATKAALFPRRKILAEINEAFTFTNSSKPPILDSRTSPARSVRSSCSSDHDDGEDEENKFDGHSSSKKPYDPLTNYLSPRPKFLRYNPNKKRRIFLHGDSDSEITEKKDGLGVVGNTSSFESRKVVEEKTFEEGFVKEESNPNDLDDEDAEMEEDIEEFDDDDDDDEEKEEEEKCWSFLGLLKFLLVLGSLFLSTTYICSMNSHDHSLIQEAIRDFRHGFLNQSNTQELVTRNDHLPSEFEVLGGKKEEFHISLPDIRQENIDVELVERGVSEVSKDDKKLLASTGRLLEVQIEKPEDVYDDGLMSKMEASDALQWAEATESETSSDVVEVSSDHLLENLSVRDQEMGGIEDELEQLQPTDTVEVKNLFSETEPSPDVNDEFEPMKSEMIRSQVEVAALVVLFTMVPALGLLYHSRQSKAASLATQKNSDEEASLPTQKDNNEEASLPAETYHPNAEPARQIQNTNAICSVEEEYVENVASFTSPSTSLASMNVVSGEFSRQRQAPIVELLGELVIGEKTFDRSSKMTKMPDPEERNASNSLFTQTTDSQSKTSLVQNQLTHLELSTVDSMSQKKKRPVKEESNGGEVSMSTMTPVRRSSRLRNKAMSP